MAAKLRRWLREAAVFLALLIAIMVVMDVWRAPQAPPAFAATPLHTLTGESTTLATLSEERPVLLYFWASWCGVCRFTTPAVARLAAEGENVMTVALRSGDDAEVARWLGNQRDTNAGGGFTRSGCVHHQRLDQLLGHEASAVVGKNVLNMRRGFPALTRLL